MSVVVRVVAGLTVVPVVFTVLLLVRLAQRGEFAALMSIDAFGRLSFVSWLITAMFGPVAIVQLMRLRPWGPAAGAVVWGNFALHQLGLACFRAASVQTIFFFIFSSIVLVVLLIPAARRVCGAGALAPGIAADV